MPTNEYAEIIDKVMLDPPLSEVIELPHTGPESFYTRNSGALPRLDQTKASDYSRAGLPSPITPEPDTFVNRIRDLVSLHRPAWLSR